MDKLLLEDGAHLLQEDGYYILLEYVIGPFPTHFRV